MTSTQDLCWILQQYIIIGTLVSQVQVSVYVNNFNNDAALRLNLNCICSTCNFVLGIVDLTMKHQQSLTQFAVHMFLTGCNCIVFDQEVRTPTLYFSVCLRPCIVSLL